MTTSLTRVVVWMPRMLGLGYVLFLSLFALDVFSENLSAGQKIEALGIHLIPSAIILVAVAVAWRWPAIGGSICIAAGLFYSVRTGVQHPTWIAIVAGPVFVIGGLFFAGAIVRRSPPTSATAN